ncbi:MAG: 50S ribosomal protein L32 [Mycoplasmoidaceae bacterium]
MAVQQRRVTPSRKGMRRSHHGLDVAILTSCSRCGSKIAQHRVCNKCGYYKNRKILEIDKV